MEVLPIPHPPASSSGADPGIYSPALRRNPPSPKVIALVDALILTRDCLMQALLPRLGQEAVIEAFGSIEEMVSSQPARFDLVLFYIHHNTRENIRAIIDAVADTPKPILVITNDQIGSLDLVFGDRLWAGICGLVSTADTNSKLLSAGIRFVLSGGTFFPLEMMVGNSAPATPSRLPRKVPGALTARQSEVFAKLQQGKPNKLIAHELGMSESTAKVHIASIMRAIGASNRTQAVSLARKRPDSDKGPPDHE